MLQDKKILFLYYDPHPAHAEMARAIVKCDVEGAEYKIFNNQSDLSGIYKLQIEYHGGEPSALAKVFEDKGFKVMMDKLWTHDSAFGDVGWMYVWRG